VCIIDTEDEIGRARSLGWPLQGGGVVRCFWRRSPAGPGPLAGSHVRVRPFQVVHGRSWSECGKVQELRPGDSSNAYTAPCLLPSAARGQASPPQTTSLAAIVSIATAQRRCHSALFVGPTPGRTLANSGATWRLEHTEVPNIRQRGVSHFRAHLTNSHLFHNHIRRVQLIFGKRIIKHTPRFGIMLVPSRRI
jgi:hypothetical protein